MRQTFESTLIAATLCNVTLTVGEDAHVAGAKGIKRAKRWLNASMRVVSIWTNTEDVHKPKLAYSWPYGSGTFSFDLGGVMRGGEFDNHIFSAEIKNYQVDHNQQAQYREFLAHCYVALGANQGMCDQLMWITWAPFGTTVWKDMFTSDYVRKAVLAERERVFGTDDSATAEGLIDESRVKAVADRVWVIILSEKQESLVPLKEWRAIVNDHLTRSGDDND